MDQYYEIETVLACHVNPCTLVSYMAYWACREGFGLAIAPQPGTF